MKQMKKKIYKCGAFSSQWTKSKDKIVSIWQVICAGYIVCKMGKIVDAVEEKLKLFIILNVDNEGEKKVEIIS